MSFNMIFSRQILATALLLVLRATADTCSDVEALSTIEVSRPLALSYIDEQRNYWSTSCAALKPTCIIFPTTADEVSTVIKILNGNNEKFAIKSGGHNPNNGWSSVAGGPLISTSKLDQVLLDPATGVCRVGPGQKLDSLAAALQGTGWTFVGGRIGPTGVGGLVLGGGLSYMSSQYGWSASSVLEYEVVLANGTIVKATKDQHSDLFKALKGGGNMFGVVTSYLVQTYRQGLVYGGQLVFLRTPETDARLLRAVRDFTEYNHDHKAAVIVTAERSTVNVIDSWIIFVFYDGTDVPPGMFKNFTDAGPLLNSAKVQTYAELIGNTKWVTFPGYVSNVMIATETVPLPSAARADEVMIDGLHAHWRNVTGGATQLVPGIIASIAYQPFPRAIAAQARNRSVDLIDCDDDADRLIIEVNYSYINVGETQALYSQMTRKMEDTYGGIRSLVKRWERSGVLPKGLYLPVFMNYGFFRQDYFARLKPANRALAKRVANAVDPRGFFRDRTGGWRP